MTATASALPTSGSLASALACPRCGGSLIPAPDGASCRKCESRFRADRGCLMFSDPLEGYGELSPAEMAKLTQLARTSGWRAAIASLPQDEQRLLRRLTEDPNRSSWTRLVPGIADQEILDLGCGYGAVSAQIAAQGARHVYAMDGSLARLQFLAARRDEERLGNLTVLCNRDYFSLPFRNGSLDAVCMIGVLEYFPAARPAEDPIEVQGKALAEIARVLRPGGRLYLGTKNRYGYEFLLGARDHNGLRFGPALPRPLARLLTRLWKRRTYSIIVHSLPEILRMLEGAGLAVEAVAWPVPSYQTPVDFFRLDAADAGEDAFARAGYSGAKRSVLRALHALGVLRYVAPNFSIVAVRR